MNASRRDILCALAATGFAWRADAAAPVFDAASRRILAAAAEAFVPGAVRAGVVEFVAAMLGSDQPMQFYTYMNFPMPPRAFYLAALAALDSYAVSKTKHAFTALSVAERQNLLRDLMSPDVDGWNGPPPFLVYIVLRNDAADVVYGGENAYEAFDLPYMAHIAPPHPW